MDIRLSGSSDKCHLLLEWAIVDICFATNAAPIPVLKCLDTKKLATYFLQFHLRRTPQSQRTPEGGEKDMAAGLALRFNI